MYPRNITPIMDEVEVETTTMEVPTTTASEDFTTTFMPTSTTTPTADVFHGASFGYGILVGTVMILAIVGMFIGYRQLKRGNYRRLE